MKLPSSADLRLNDSSHLLRRSLIALLLLALLAGCGIPALAPAPAAPVSPVSQIALAGDGDEPTPDYVVAPPDATPTPTPFQPIPPTAAFEPTETPAPTFTPFPTLTPTPGSGEEIPIIPTSLVQPPDQINILLLGADQRPGSAHFRTDTIILATINTELGTAHLTSFPRDLYVTVPGHGQDRINTAYFYGGIKLLYDTFQTNFNVRPDHYVLINFSSFKQVVDQLGGLDVNVGKALTDYRGGYGYVTIPAGIVHMDADAVLWYARSRKTTNDFERNRRQQEVIQAIFDKLLTVESIKRAPEFYDLYHKNVITDISLADVFPLLPLAAEVAKDRSRIQQYFVGPKYVDGWITPGGAMVLLPRKDKINHLLRDALNLR